ncbi:MAG: MbnP family protein [Saprospiraceae bacterium]
MMMRYFLLLLPLLLLTACYEPVEGCLNTSATNFDIDADEACADCCTFPQLKIRFLSVWPLADTTPLVSRDSVYTDALGQPFRFFRIRYYWSDIALQLQDGNRLSILDSIAVKIAAQGDTSSLTLVDDFMLADIDRANRTFTVGTLEASGIMAGLLARFGIADPANRTVITSVSPSSHPLAPQIGGMNWGADDGFVFAKIEYFQDTVATDTVPGSSILSVATSSANGTCLFPSRWH